MQLPLSADLLIPVGVGVLVAVVAVIVLKIGLRRRADDAPVPTHEDWTGERVGEVAAPRTRTVADAVAARQGNTNPFLVVSPEQSAPVVGAGVDEQDAAELAADAGGGPVRGQARPLSVRGSEVSTSALGVRSRHAAQLGGRATSVALAEPVSAGSAPATVPEVADEAAPGPAAVSAEARHVRPADEGDGPTYPSDPLFGAGCSHEVGGAWLGPSAGPQARRGDSSCPGAAEHRPAGSSDELPEQRSDPAGDHRPDAAPAEPTGPGRPGDRPTDPASTVPAPEGALAGPEAAHPLAAGPAATPRPAVGAEQSFDHRPAAGGPIAARPVDDGPAAGPLAAGPSAAGGSDPAPSGPSADGRSVAGDVASAPAGLSADGHPVAGGVPSPAGLSADGHPVAGGGSGSSDASAAGHPAAEGTEPGPAAGSSQSVAAAVAHVLAARAAAHAPEGDRRGDARDRLLAVLLDDPLRAVGAAVDLQDCQERIDRLTAGLKDERGRLGDVLGRLARSGLRPDQLARLSGLSDIEVAEFLRRGPTA